MTIILTLPLPHKGLRPNSFVKWNVRFGLTKQAREWAKRAMFEAARQIEAQVWVITGYRLKGYFKTKRHLDDDNLASSTKAYRDGIAESAGQDDRTFRCLGVETFTDTKNPRLEIEISIDEIV